MGYDPVKSLVKAGKALAVVMVGSLIAGLVGSDITAVLSTLADELAAGVPYVGAILAPVVKGGLVAAVAAAVEGLRNLLKHYNS